MKLISFLGEAGSGKDTAGELLVREQGFYGLALADPIKLFCMWVLGWDPQLLWGPSALRDTADPCLPFVRCPNCGYVPYVPGITNITHMRTCLLCRHEGVANKWAGHLSPRFALQRLGTEWCHPLKRSGQVDFGVRRAQIVMNKGVQHDPLWSVLPDFVLKARTPRYTTTASTGDFCPRGVYISDMRFRHEITPIQTAGGKVYRVRRRDKTDNTTTGVPDHLSEMEQRQIPDEVLDGVIPNHDTLDALSERLRTLIQL